MKQKPSTAPIPFGQRIRQVREKLGLSGAAFAKTVGCDRSYVFRLEQGSAANPSLNFIEAVVSKFGVDREWLVGGADVEAGRELRMTIKPAGTIDGYIRMRLDCVEDTIETLSQEQLRLLLDRLKELEKVDKQFGRVFAALANATAYIVLRRQTKGSK